MANRIGDGPRQLVWRMPDSRESGIPMSVTLPHPFMHLPFMHLPSADEIVAPMMRTRYLKLTAGPKGKGKLWPFDTNLIRPGMPTAIRNGFLKKLIHEILNERKRPSPAIKAPPKRNGKARKGKKQPKGFVGIVRQGRSAKASPASPGVPAPHAHMAMGGSNHLGISLAAHVSAMTFVRR